MQRLWIRSIAVFGVLMCATVGAVSEWPTGRHVRTEDRNGDGRPDVWHEYDDKGQPTEVRFDTNFDGRSDVQEYYDRGTLVRRESDRNFDDRVDLVEEFDRGTHDQVRSVVDCDYDGTADLLVLFRDGRPVFSKLASSPPAHVTTAVRAAFAQNRGRRADDPLIPLADPFRAATVIRQLDATPNSPQIIGLLTSWGLPRSSVGSPSPLCLTVGFIARDVPRVELMDLSISSPRGPPPSNHRLVFP